MRHQARKRFGQHFLIDTGITEAIVRAIDPRPDDALVEIGPGLGALTRPLLQRGARLTVIELDRDLAARWRDVPNVRVVEADVLGVDFVALARDAGRPLRVVGNLPYNISTPILFRLLGAVASIEDQHLMLQKEVVDRMAASPGRKDYGRLTVMLQWRYDIEPLFDVPPGSFDPPPRVQSTVLRMTPLPTPPPLDAAMLGELVSVAFSQRRKLLRHTLGQWLASAQLGIEFNLQRRAEEVPVAEYVALAQELERRGRRAAASG
jgi:16S rRNA (adenine1518-N6/adenine1519-N6)-dimethyltransferase